MNREFILKHTGDYQENLIKRLRDPELAQAYLEAAIESYEEDGDTECLLLAMRDVAKAQGDVGELASRTGISRQHLYNVLASKYHPPLDHLLNILSALGFRVRLERQDVTI